MVLDTTQFNQLVQEVREALLVGSQGVGEIEVVTSLAGLVSLPALRLVGASESVVEAPLDLLSAPAVEAAADARKATDDAIIAAVNAEAAADLSEAERKDLEEIKLQTISAANDASSGVYAAMEAAGKADEATLHAMRTASLLQGKLEEAQVIILAGEANQEILDELNSQVHGSILICAGTRDEAYSAILQLRELQAQVSQAIMYAYVAFDQMQLSTDESRHATELAYRATAKMEELSERTERVIVESVVQTGEAKQMVIRLEDLEKNLLFSQSAADMAATRADTNADLAKRIAEATELVRQKAIYETDRAKEAADKADKAAADAIFSAAGADSAGGHATEEAEAAHLAALRSNTLSDNPIKIVDGVWHRYDETTDSYVSTGVQAKGDTGSSFNIIGLYDTVELLNAAVADGSDVDGVYAVGLNPPYAYYAWVYKGESWGWHSQGELQGRRGESAFEGVVRMQGYTGTEEEYVKSPILGAKTALDAASAAIETDNAIKEAERLRVLAEMNRTNAETERATAETNRATEESKRVAAETGRVDAEKTRVTSTAKVITDTNAAKDTAIKETAKAIKATNDANAATTGANEAAGGAGTQAEAARLAAERSNTLSDNLPKIVEGYWFVYDEESEKYVSTGVQAVGSGNDFTPFTELGDVEIQAGEFYGGAAGWNSFTFPTKFTGIPAVICAVKVEEGGCSDFFVNLQYITEYGFLYHVTYVNTEAYGTSSAELETIMYQAIYSNN